MSKSNWDLRLDHFKKAAKASKPDGFLTLDGAVVADTKRCVHCQRHWIWVSGSGAKRGYCRACDGYLCGAPECFTCVNWEKKLDMIDLGRSPTKKQI